MLSLTMAVISIVIIDLVLSGDNALVIAMACRRLPDKQQKKAIILGTGLAIILRVALTVVAVYLLKIPLLQLIGGLLLVWIAIKLLKENSCPGAGTEEKVCEADHFWSAVKTIIVADFVMSLDNVLGVAAAAHGNIWLLAFGLALSIPIMVLGSRLIIALMKRFPYLVYIGAGILGWTAAQMIVHDRFLHSLMDLALLDKVLPPVLALGVVMWGRMRARRYEMAGAGAAVHAVQDIKKSVS